MLIGSGGFVEEGRRVLEGSRERKREREIDLSKDERKSLELSARWCACILTAEQPLHVI